MSLVNFTDQAVAHIKKLMSKNTGSIGFRLSIKKTGCSGYSYVPNLVECVNENDLHFLAQDQLKIYIDPECQHLIKGLLVDYVKEGLGLKQERLIFINPNERNRCGCGESFTIE